MSYHPRSAHCIDCDNTYTRTGASQHRCPVCQREAELRRGRDYYYSHRAEMILKANLRKTNNTNTDCDRCKRRGICQRIVRTQAPLPCWEEWEDYTKAQRYAMGKIPASFRIPEEVG